MGEFTVVRGFLEGGEAVTMRSGRVKAGEGVADGGVDELLGCFPVIHTEWGLPHIDRKQLPSCRAPAGAVEAKHDDVAVFAARPFSVPGSPSCGLGGDGRSLWARRRSGRGRRLPV